MKVRKNTNKGTKRELVKGKNKQTKKPGNKLVHIVTMISHLMYESKKQTNKKV